MATNDAGGTPRSLAPFTAFSCGAVDAPGTDLQYCWKYQMEEDAVFWAKDETG